jgi:hypothetical protein
MDIDNTNPNLVIGVSDNLSELLTVHVPDFKEPTISVARLSGDYTVCKKIFSEADWVTPDLRRLIETLFPTGDAINSGTRVRDKVAFMNACTILFKEGRIFSSPMQLKQVATVFLDKWGSQCAKHGKKIVCYYHSPMVQKKGNEDESNSNRKVYKVKESQKSLIKCPFEIRYSLIEKVVRCFNFNHSCDT